MRKKKEFSKLKRGAKFRYQRKLFIKINSYSAVHLITGAYIRYLFPDTFGKCADDVFNTPVTPVKVGFMVK